MKTIMNGHGIGLLKEDGGGGLESSGSEFATPRKGAMISISPATNGIRIRVRNTAAEGDPTSNSLKNMFTLNLSSSEAESLMRSIAKHIKAERAADPS